MAREFTGLRSDRDIHIDGAARDGEVRLGDAWRGFSGTVVAITADRVGGGLDASELERRLLEIGFVEGARVELLHEGAFGRDPIAVKLDDARVALRRREAQAVLLRVGYDDGAGGWLQAAE